MLKRFNLPQLLRDLKRLNLRHSRFGGVNDTFEYRGPYLKKKRIGKIASSIQTVQCNYKKRLHK